jgi:hypothetical protein
MSVYVSTKDMKQAIEEINDTWESWRITELLMAMLDRIEILEQTKVSK